ncbi:sporulation-control protein [Lipingzhangella halophila]|uniref:Sporulation-control protein n=1 Tax=Lipingzhangella halophila TaxID=1783352 RepID=A0A7W7RIF6_9ACTN|nr:sporulation protein [Lipingzhangella halophila]MBB4932612.1 sporulation-control protein [Lipingzhangella halophila]
MKRILASLGLGNASVEAVLSDANTVPGGVLHGEVFLTGGSVDQRIEQLTVGLQTRAEMEIGDNEVQRNLEFGRTRIGGELHLQPGAELRVPFQLAVPWESPITSHRGRNLRGMRVGVNTQLHVAGGVDPGDLDPVAIHALDSQTLLLDAMERLGFAFTKADCEQGKLRGTRQQLPFYQEIEYRAPGSYPGISELELSFVSDQQGCDVVLELDKKGGLVSESRDTFRRFRIEHATAAQEDWAAQLHEIFHKVGGQRRWL